MYDLLNFIISEFPFLDVRFGWGQPMFSNKGTFIVSFKNTKNHIGVVLETYTIDKFKEKIESKNYPTTSMLYKIGWDQKVDYNLLKELVEFNIEDKKGYLKFWR